MSSVFEIEAQYDFAIDVFNEIKHEFYASSRHYPVSIMVDTICITECIARRVRDAATSCSQIVTDIHKGAEILCPHLAAAAAAKRDREQQADDDDHSTGPPQAEPDAAAQTTPTTFPRFAALPLEMQMAIWDAAAEPPSCVELVDLWEKSASAVRCSFGYGYVYTERKTAAGTSVQRMRVELLHAVPLLTVCRAAHAAAMRAYAARDNIALFCHHVDHEMMAEQDRRLGELSYQATHLWNCLDKLRAWVETRLLSCEWLLRTVLREAVLETPTRTAALPYRIARMREDPIGSLMSESVIVAAIRVLFPLEGHYPLTSEEHIPPHALGHAQLNPRLRETEPDEDAWWAAGWET